MATRSLTVDDSLVASLPSVTTTELKNNFGDVVRQATREAVAITRHRRPEFVLVPAAEYAQLRQSQQAPLDALTAEFDAMVAQMNTPASKQAVDQFFAATSKELGQAAVNAVTKHGE